MDWIRDLGSRKKHTSDPGSRNLKSTGSRIRIRNTDIFHVLPLTLVCPFIGQRLIIKNNSSCHEDVVPVKGQTVLSFLTPIIVLVMTLWCRKIAM